MSSKKNTYQDKRLTYPALILPRRKKNILSADDGATRKNKKRPFIYLLRGFTQ